MPILNQIASNWSFQEREKLNQNWSVIEDYLFNLQDEIRTLTNDADIRELIERFNVISNESNMVIIELEKVLQDAPAVIASAQNATAEAIKQANQAAEKANYANSQGLQAKVQADYAKNQGDKIGIALDEVTEQSLHAKVQGDYAKREADRLAGLEVSVLDTKITNLNNATGSLSTLKTNNKNSLVNAINELYDSKINRPFIYGVKIDTANSNPDSALTYTDDAVGSVPLKVTNGVTNWGSWADKYPFNKIVPIVVKDGVEQYELNPNDFTQKKDGTPSIIAGADGDVFSRFPKIWWKIERIGTDVFVRIATAKVDGFKCLAHTVAGVEKDYAYIGSYMGFLENGKLRSLSGKTATANQTIGTFRTQAQANGTGYTQFDYYKLLMVQILTLIVTKSRDSQSSIGRGYVDNNTTHAATGGTDKKGMFYGESTGKQQMKIFGIEDFWGNYYQFIDGLHIDTVGNILIGDKNFNDGGNGYANYGKTSEVIGYLSDIQGGTETGFIAKETQGASSTHYTDYAYLSYGKMPYFGGYRIGSSTSGAFRLCISEDANKAFESYSARCCFVK